MKKICYLIAAVLFGLTGCTSSPSVSSSESPEGAIGDGKPRVGLHYFLPRGKIRMTGTCTKDDCDNSFKIATARVLEADSNQRCFLSYNPNALYDDEFTLETDENGLLKTVNSTSTDQTPAIIEAVTETAVNLIKSAAAFGILAEKPKLRPFVYTFDPLNSDEYRAAKRFLQPMGINLKVEAQAIPEAKAIAAIANAGNGVSNEGVFYHPPLAVALRFSIGDPDKPEMSDSVVHVLPNYRLTESLSLRRAALVKQQTQLAFSSGMVSQVKLTRPSQALAAVQIPQKIAKTAAEAIPAIFKIQSEAATRDLKNETAVLQAQRDYLQAQIDLQKRKAELDKLRQENSSPGGNASANRSTANPLAGPNAESPSPTPSPEQR